MKTNITELVFILDRSGSMSGLEQDTIGGFNSLLQKQKKEVGEAVVTTVLFDDRYELLHDRIDIKGIKPITEQEYFVRGTTALFDALGKTISKIAGTQKHTIKELRADKVMFVITTDGMENASREYSEVKIKEMIEGQKQKYCWEFIFLVANIDAIETASKFGIGADRAANYNADKLGVELNYRSLSKVMSNIRKDKTIRPDWKTEIDEDYKNRRKI